MNLATQTPAKQVAYVLAGLVRGEVPDLPPFLKVDAKEQARRNKWALAHPIVQTKFMEREVLRGAPPPEVYVPAPPPEPKKAAAVHIDMTGFRWDHRRGRFIPEGYEPPAKLTAKITDEEARLTAALHKANAARPAARKAKAVAPKPVVTGSAKPVPGTMLEGEKPIACLIRLLRRPEGVTLQEAADACGWAGPHTAQARIGSDLKKKASLLIDQTEEARGRVYRIAE